MNFLFGVWFGGFVSHIVIINNTRCCGGLQPLDFVTCTGWPLMMGWFFIRRTVAILKGEDHHG